MFKSSSNMEKHDIESILIANCYLMQCKFGYKCREKSEVARRFLSRKIRKALEKKLSNDKAQFSNADSNADSK
jgi:hypothetical protein